MRMMTAILALAAMGTIAVPVSANEDDSMALPTAEQLDAIAERIPDQEWYPDGYYDIRIAAVAD